MFEWVTSVIERLGYVGVATLTFLENIFPLIPSELVIPLAGFIAANGRLRLDLVIAIGSIGGSDDVAPVCSMLARHLGATGSKPYCRDRRAVGPSFISGSSAAR